MKTGATVKNRRSGNVGIISTIGTDTVTVRIHGASRNATWKTASLEVFPENCKYDLMIGDEVHTADKEEIVEILSSQDMETVEKIDIYLSGTAKTAKREHVCSFRSGFDMGFFSEIHMNKILYNRMFPEQKQEAEEQPYLMLPLLPDSEDAESPSESTDETDLNDLVRHNHTAETGLVISKKDERVSVLIIPPPENALDPDQMAVWHRRETVLVPFGEATAYEKMHMCPETASRRDYGVVMRRIRIAQAMRGCAVRPVICRDTGRQFFPLPDLYSWGLEIIFNPMNTKVLTSYFSKLPVEICWPHGAAKSPVLVFCRHQHEFVNPETVRSGTLKKYVERIRPYPLGTEVTQ